MIRALRLLLCVIAILHVAAWVIALCSRLSLSRDVPQYLLGHRIGADLADSLKGFELVGMFLCGPILAAVGIAVLAVRWADKRPSAKPGRCRSCGYNLTGNTSGVCPECGAAVARVTPAVSQSP